MNIFNDEKNKWPSNGLENLDYCPVCGSSQYDILYDKLTDRVFFCAPGEWTFVKCNGCHAVFLNPRPNIETIHLAYENYYTHKEEKVKLSINASEKSSISFKSKLRNGYLNSTYNVDYSPSYKIGKLIVNNILGTGFIRHLPSKLGILADIGCGNGDYLRFIQKLGWEGWGVDLDINAITYAKSTGLNVRQSGLPNTGLPTDKFDYVTLNQVIEHIHDPHSALKEIYRILKPGGIVLIATPNLESFTHKRFQSNWIQLDPPRHLILYTYKILNNLLLQEEFTNIQPKRSAFLAPWSYKGSQKLADIDMNNDLVIRKISNVFYDIICLILSFHSENIVVTAQKPK